MSRSGTLTQRLSASGVQNSDALDQAISPSLTGLWKKDYQLSDSMKEACDAVDLNPILRQAIRVISTMQVEDSSTHFKTVLKAGGLLDVVECYPWNGEQVLHSRRDKRAGQHRGVVRKTDMGPEIAVEWDNPLAGTCSDVFSISEGGNMLTVTTDMYINKKQLRCQYKSVYRRKL